MSQMIVFGYNLVVPGSYPPVTDQGLVNAPNKQTRARAYKYFVAELPTARADRF